MRRAFLIIFAVSCAAPQAFVHAQFSSAQEAYNAGAKFINQGNLAGARQPLEDALALATNDAFRLKVNKTLLIPYRELQEIEPMQRAAEYVLTHSQQKAERSLTRGTLLAFIHRRGKLDAALEGYEARLTKTPDDRTVLYLLAEAYARYKNNPERSAAHGEKLAEVEKKLGKGPDVDGQAHLAQQYVSSGKHKLGAELYETIAPLDKNLEAWHYKEAAAAWLKASDAKKAVAAAKKSASAAPEKRTSLLTYFWHNGLGDVFLEGGEPALAIPHYEKAIAATTIEGSRKSTQAKLLQAQAAAKK